jgi:hypothetical protein
MPFSSWRRPCVQTQILIRKKFIFLSLKKERCENLDLKKHSGMTREYYLSPNRKIF